MVGDRQPALPPAKHQSCINCLRPISPCPPPATPKPISVIFFLPSKSFALGITGCAGVCSRLSPRRRRTRAEKRRARFPFRTVLQPELSGSFQPRPQPLAHTPPSLPDPSPSQRTAGAFFPCLSHRPQGFPRSVPLLPSSSGPRSASPTPPSPPGNFAWLYGSVPSGIPGTPSLRTRSGGSITAFGGSKHDRARESQR